MTKSNSHEKNNSKKVVIMGAGPAGLTAAYKLTKAGIPNTTIEKADDVGGISRTVTYKGYRFDIGGHRFFTKIEAVEEMWKEVIEKKDYLRRSRLSRIYYNRKFFSYPLRIGNALRGLGILNGFLIVISYLKSQVIGYIFPYRPEKSFEDWVSNRFGHRLYTTFFKTYTEKVWGIPCTELSAEWAAQRIKGLSLTSAVRNALVRKQSSDKRKVIKTLIDSFDYPRYGPGMMWQATRDQVLAAGNTVHMETSVDRIRWDESGVSAIEVSAQGEKSVIDGSHFLSTIPMRELVRKLDPPPPQSILEAAKLLVYRDFLTVALIIDVDQLFPDNWIYIHDPRVKVGRIQNFKNWSEEMVAEPDKTCLGLEYFCFEGDGLWNMEDKALVKLASEELDLLGLADKSKIKDGAVVRQEKAYPVYNSTYKKGLDAVRTFIKTNLPNLQLIGRNGMHKYNNQDHSMLTAMFAVKNILGANYDIWNVNTEEEYHEEESKKSSNGVTPDDLAKVEATQPQVPTKL